MFTTTYGYGDDFKEEGIRRLLVNACYWCVALEDRIPARSDVDLVGPYEPVKSNYAGHRRGVKPRDLRLEK